MSNKTIPGSWCSSSLQQLAAEDNLYPASPVEHGALLHGAGSSGVAVATKPAGRWSERVYPAGELPEVLSRYAGERDVYLSTQSFFGWRRICQLAACGALAVDVDFHKVPALAQMHPRGVLEDCRIALERAGQPEPSLAISSGRGLYLLWLHGKVPRQALPRWNAAQRALWETLRPLGADRGALDAARVLRLVGSRNSKNGAFVETIRGPGDAWAFGDLADEVLPHTREELYDLRVQRAARDAQRSEKPEKPQQAPPKGYTAATLWDARLADLQALRRLRHGVQLPPGQRDHWLFLAGVAMSWLCEPSVLRRELYDLAREVGGWDDRESKSRMQAVFSRTHAAARGDTVEWQGVQVDSRYRFKNGTIMELLEITPQEEGAMRTLISPDEERRRHREREEKRRREVGAVPRDQYLRPAQQRRVEAHRLRSEEGLSLRGIAARMDVSKSQVGRLLAVPPSNCPASVPLYGGVASAVSGQESGRPVESQSREPELVSVIETEAEVFALLRDRAKRMPSSDWRVCWGTRERLMA